MMDRNFVVEYMPSDASFDEATEIYLLANRGGGKYPCGKDQLT